MNQMEQSNQESPKIKFMRNALDKHPSTVDFTLPNNRIVKIRKIDPSYLNVTDEQKDKIYENHQEGSPIFILKKRVIDSPSNDANTANSKSKITIRRVVKNIFDNGNEKNQHTSNNDTTLIRKLVVGDVINVFEDTRDEQANTVIKSFVFVPTSEIVQPRNIQIENEIESQIQNASSLNESLSGNEAESDIELSGPSDDDDNKGHLPKPSTISNANGEKSNSSENEIENEKGIIEDIEEEIIEEEEEEAEAPENNPSFKNRDVQLILEEEEEEIEPIENVNEDVPQFTNDFINTPQEQNINDEAAEFAQNDEQTPNYEEQLPQFTNYVDEDQQFYDANGQVPQFTNFDEQLQQNGDYGDQLQQYTANDEQFQQLGNDQEQQYIANDQFQQDGDQAQQYVNGDEQFQQYGDQAQQYVNGDEQFQQYTNNDEQFQQFENYEEQAPQYVANEDEKQQFFDANDQVSQNIENEGETQQSINMNEQVPNMIIDGEMPQFVNTGDEVANLLDMGDDMQSLGDKFTFFNMGEEEES